MSSNPSLPANMANLATTFAALGDIRRLALVERLYNDDALSISVLCKGMDVSRQAVSKHLKTLSEAQLVSSERSGRETLYSLEKQTLEDANAYLRLVGQKWDDALNQLQTHLDPYIPLLTDAASCTDDCQVWEADVRCKCNLKKQLRKTDVRKMPFHQTSEIIVMGWIALPGGTSITLGLGNACGWFCAIPLRANVWTCWYTSKLASVVHSKRRCRFVNCAVSAAATHKEQRISLNPLP